MWTYSLFVDVLFSIASNISSTESKWTKHHGLLSTSVIDFDTSSGFLSTSLIINAFNNLFTCRNFCVFQFVQQYFRVHTSVDLFLTSFCIFYPTLFLIFCCQSIHFVHLLSSDILQTRLDMRLLSIQAIYTCIYLSKVWKAMFSSLLVILT